MNNGIKHFVPIFVWLSRLITGVVFVLSGILKGIDPWGTIYIFEEYFSALDIVSWDSLTLVGVFFLSSLEFVIGIFLITGSFRRSAPVVAFLIMCLMLPLTLWIAIKDPIESCGCFGEAFHISNWATFWKNIILTGLIIFLIIKNKKSPCVISPYLQWINLVLSVFFIVLIEFIGYSYQPLIDFRDFPVGSSIVSQNNEDNFTDISDDEPRFLFKYRKGDEIKTFTENDELPDEDQGWEFISREEINPESPSKIDESGKNLRIYGKENNDDLTGEELTDEGKLIIIFSPEVSKVSPSSIWKINFIHHWALENKIKMIAIVSGSPEDIDEWEDISKNDYPIYLADDTVIKQIVRGNPGIVFVENGVIIWKTSLKSLDIKNLEEESDDVLSNGQVNNQTNEIKPIIENNNRLFLNICFLYVILIGVLIGVSFMFSLKKEKRNGSIKQENKNNGPVTES